VKRYQLIIEYDGSHYGGWQRQANSLTVQQVVEEALSTVVGVAVTLFSSGRTDAGVHAQGMSAHFDSPRELPERAYREGVNRLLPDDVVVREVHAVADDFHARFGAQGKWYRYQLYVGAVRSALHRQRSWHLRKPLDLDLMRRAAQLLIGEHDFEAFRVSSCNATTSVRRIDLLRVSTEGDFVIIDVVGSGFLRYMVRRITGTLVEVATGRRTLQSVEQMLNRPKEFSAGVTAPAFGLILMRVRYPGKDLEFWENFP